MDGYTNSVLNIHQPLTHHDLMDNGQRFISNQSASVVNDKMVKSNFLNNENVKLFNMNKITYPQSNHLKKENPNHLEEAGVARNSWYENENRDRDIYKLQNHPSKTTYPAPNYFQIKNFDCVDKILLPSAKLLQNKGNSNKAQKRKSRTVLRFSPLQREKLEEEFERSNYLDPLETNSLAQSLKMTKKQVANWFKNRRTKQTRKQKKDSEQVSRSQCLYENSQLENSKEPINHQNEEMETVVASNNSIPKHPYWNQMSTPSPKNENKNTTAVSDVVTKFLYRNEIPHDQVQYNMHNFFQYPSPALSSYESHFSLPRIDYFGNQLTYNDYMYMYNQYYFDNMNYYNPNIYHATQSANFDIKGKYVP